MPVSLHTHSWYSPLEGTASLDRLLEHAAGGGHTALALTDTNNLCGVVPFVEKARRLGVRPLVGACLRQGSTRCVALVAEPEGYANLCRVLSRLHLQEDAVLTELLRACAADLHVLVDDPALAAQLREAFGSRLWLEVVRPHPGGARHEQALHECGRRLGLRLVASMAAHLADPAEYPTFRLITAIRRRTLLDRLPRMLAITPEHHLASVAAFRERFADLPQAIRHGDDLADLLRSDVLPRSLILPEPRLRPGQKSDSASLHSYLSDECERGLRWRERGADLEARQRLRYELELIGEARLSGYFLTVRDIARHARKRGHSMALRGSAGCSLICYLLGITDVDPLRFGLGLERFLHPGRVDLPDIDLDFDWRVRDDVIANLVRCYGAAHAAQISSHLSLQPRSAFREAGRLHGLSERQISTLLTELPEEVDALLLAEAPPAAPPSFPLEPERWPRILADGRRLIGRPHHLSIHPGGVVITPQPLEGYVPLQWAAKGVTITQFDKDGVEAIGLVKIDLLGNRALASVDEGRRHAVQAGEPDAAVTALSQERDPATVELLRQGDTLGVNQLESPAMRHLLIQIRPRGLDDVIQALALLRPGAAGIGMKERFIRRRLGLESYRPAHPKLARLLSETHGLLLYEDDTLRLVQALTGLPAAEADHFRKRITKYETEDEARQLKEEFLALCTQRRSVSDASQKRASVSDASQKRSSLPPGQEKRFCEASLTGDGERFCEASLTDGVALTEGVALTGDAVPPEALEELWLQLSKFNRYSFCKSHAVSYGLIAWQSSWLKAHCPLAFWTAALNNNMGAYPRRVYVEAVKRAGLRLLLPCVNRSDDLFTVEGEAIRTGLGVIAGLPLPLRQRLMDKRRADGPFRGLADFRRRVKPGPKTLALLIRCGALDALGPSRSALFLEAELQGRSPDGFVSLFADDPLSGGAPPDSDLKQRLRDEWETLGFVTGPPLFALFRKADPRIHPPLVASRDLPAHRGRLVRVQGLVATARHTFTTDGRPLQFVSLEDEHGLSEVTLFPGTCRQVPYLTLGPYVATGTVDEQYGVITLTARSFELCERPAAKPAGPSGSPG
jgi:DNA polymerase III alpha subunit